MFKKICKKLVNYFKEMYNNYQQFGPPIMQGSGAPNSDMQGKWSKLHPQFPGPDVLIVRDAIMDGNDMIVITDQGNMSMSEFANNYYKESDEEYNLDGSVKAVSSQMPSTPVPQTPSSNLDYNLLTAGMTPSEDTALPEDEFPQAAAYVPQDTIVPKVKQEQSTVNIEVKTPVNSTIDKVFSKLNSTPQVDISINWDEFPKGEIEMLMKYFDVSLDDIAKYIVSIYTTPEAINSAIKSKLEELIS